jgi:hypothetical protein
MNLNDDRVKAFLKDLTELSRKHHIAIGGCGCCGSPYLSDIPDEKLDDIYVVSILAGTYDCLSMRSKEGMAKSEIC